MREHLDSNRRRNLIDEARAKDPELARLLDAYEAEILRYGKHLTPYSKNAAEAGARFAEHFPEAGLAWAMEHTGQQPWEEFIKALYGIDPEAAFGNLNSLPYEYKFYYLLVLTPQVQGQDFQRLIAILDDRKKTEGMPDRERGMVFLEMGRRDADVGWQLTREQLSDATLPAYLEGLISLNQGEAFPVHLLNDIPREEQIELVRTANQELSGEVSQTGLAVWLATQPVSADYIEVYKSLASNPEIPNSFREKAAGWVRAVEVEEGR